MDLATHSCKPVTGENTSFEYATTLDASLSNRLNGMHQAGVQVNPPALAGWDCSGGNPVNDALYKQASDCAVAEFQLMKPEALPLNTQGKTPEESLSIKLTVFNNLCAIALVELYNLCHKNHSYAGRMLVVKDIFKLSHTANLSLLEILTVLEFLSMAVDNALARQGLPPVVGSLKECTRALVEQINQMALSGNQNFAPAAYGTAVKSTFPGTYGHPSNFAGGLGSSGDMIHPSVNHAAVLSQFQNAATLPHLPQLNPNLFKLPVSNRFDVPAVIHTNSVPRQYVAERVTKRNMAYLFGSLKSKPFPLFKKRKVGSGVHVGLSKIPNGVRLINMHIFHRTIAEGSFSRAIKSFEDYDESINFKHGAIFTLVFESCPGTSQA